MFDPKAQENPPSPSPSPRGTESRGLIMIYTGNGKGKTTAALGLVFRALGRNMSVAVVQFIKGKWKTGERLFAEQLPQLSFQVMGHGFTWESDDLSQDKQAAVSAWEEALRTINTGEKQLVILDELTYAFHYGWLQVDDVVEALRQRPQHVHVVITGRNAPAELLESADLVTEMQAVKHPYSQGMKAQMGVDY